MPRLADMLRFKRELFFEGAVQLDWFYDPQRREAASRAFVFHGPQYFGISRDDVQAGSHEPVDTCTFARMLAQRLYDEGAENPLIMAIGGYGSGKSHLALTLASLFGFSASEPLSKQIIKNIGDADASIGEQIREVIDRPNLVIALNGMKDFNLTYEILNCARKALKLHNVDESPLRTITRSYDLARSFVKRSFDRYTEEFEQAAAEAGMPSTGRNLAAYLTENLDADTNAFEVVNKVYQQATGVPIRWDDGISAGDVLAKLDEAFCGDRGVFNKILILFDEFGRFIEYASEFPTRAGEAAIQQVFEAVQNANGNVVFVGFIQSDLKTYLARVQKSSSIVRYVGRFEASDKVYLSSNLETIFANLIERKNQNLFSTYVSGNRSRTLEYWQSFHTDLLSWVPRASERALWREWDRFSKVVLEGTYPLHPLTTWMLANLSSWLQQRSALTFVNSEFETLATNELFEFSEPPMVYPIRLIESDFFTELLRAEEEGRQQSEYCVLYNQVLRKHKDKCSQIMLDVLAANVILRIGRFKTSNRAEAIRALSYCIPHNRKAIEEALYNLENELGVLSFDDSAGCFDFVEDATGAEDFRRFIRKLRDKTHTHIEPSLAFADPDVKELLGVQTAVNTSFASKKGIRTQEWQYTQEILPLADITSRTVEGMKTEWLKATSPDKPKGRIVWVYMGPNDTLDALQRLQELIRVNDLDQSPILFFLVNDGEGRLLDAVKDLIMLKGMSSEERAKFARFIPDYQSKTARAVEDTFKEIAARRELITPAGISQVNIRLADYCEARFDQVYPRVIPFQFEGFQNKNIAPAKKLLAQIAKNLLTGRMDYQSVQAMSRDSKNRVEAVLVADWYMSWGVLSREIQLSYPQNEGVRSIYREIDNALESQGSLDIARIFFRYLAPPYGLNEFSLGLLLACYIAYKGPGIKVRLNGTLIKTLDWAERTYLDKGIDFRILEDTQLVQVDVDKYLARYTQLCERIEHTSDVSEARELDAELRRLKQEQDVPRDLDYRVKACEMMLEEALRLYAHVSRLLESQYEALQHAIADPAHLDMVKLLGVISACEDRSGYIPGSSRFKFSPDQTDQFERLAAKARAYVEKHFESWLTALKCDSVAQVSRFESFMEKLIKTLNDVGYVNFARKARGRLDAILSNMAHIRMLQTIRERIESYLRDCKPSSLATYNQLSEWMRTGRELKDFVRTHPNLSDAEIADYQAKIDQKLDAVEKAFKELHLQVSEAYDMAFALSTVQDCHTLLAKMKAIFSRNIKNEDRESLDAIARDTERFIADLDSLSAVGGGRQNVRKAIERLRTKWDGQDSGIDFNVVLDSLWADYETRFDEQDRAWSDRYLRYGPADIAGWEAEQCVRWQEDTRLLPDYLREETVHLYSEIKDMVQERLNALNIESVVTMFARLTPEQKRVCLIKLIEQMNDATETLDRALSAIK